jgi:hypothetical protein
MCVVFISRSVLKVLKTRYVNVTSRDDKHVAVAYSETNSSFSVLMELLWIIRAYLYILQNL